MSNTEQGLFLSKLPPWTTDYTNGCASLNWYMLNWLLKLKTLCGDLTFSGNQFHSKGADIAKPPLPIIFLDRLRKLISTFHNAVQACFNWKNL